MSLFEDYKYDLQFAADFPFGVPCEFWKSKEGKIAVKDMTDQHIKNCMKLVGVDNPWYSYFEKELEKRGN